MSHFSAALPFNAGDSYQLKEGHRHPKHRLFALASLPNIRYPDGSYGKGFVFACGTRETIEQRDRITIVEIPEAASITEKDVLQCTPKDFVATEYGNYRTLLHGNPEDRKQIAPIEELLVQAGFPNKSVKPTPTDPAILAQIGPRRVIKKGA